MSKEKTVNQIISEYVDRNDVKGLAEYFKAYITDELLEKEEYCPECLGCVCAKGRCDIHDNYKYDEFKT